MPARLAHAIKADKPHLWKADTRASVAAEQFRANSGLRWQESVVKTLISVMEAFKAAVFDLPAVRVFPKSF